MTYEQIRLILTARMAAFGGITQDRIDYPNQPTVFNTPESGLWCRFIILHATPFMAGMANAPYTRRPGQITIQCFARERTGTKAVNEIADALIAHFGYWSSGDLECMEAGQAIAGEFEGFYQVNVNIRFRAG